MEQHQSNFVDETHFGQSFAWKLTERLMDCRSFAWKEVASDVIEISFDGLCKMWQIQIHGRPISGVFCQCVKEYTSTVYRLYDLWAEHRKPRRIFDEYDSIHSNTVLQRQCSSHNNSSCVCN